ncbi:MAG: hypothetical protein WDW38_000379 [Sanguina aurantia]
MVDSVALVLKAVGARGVASALQLPQPTLPARLPNPTVAPSSTEWPLHPFMTSCIPCKLQLPQPTLPAQASNPTVAVIH